MTDQAERERFEKFAKANFCVGYPECDGDLEGMRHEDKCPAKGKSLTHWDTWQAAVRAERERIAQMLEDSVRHRSDIQIPRFVLDFVKYLLHEEKP